MGRRRVGLALGAVAIVTAAGLLAAQAPSPGGSSSPTAPQGAPSPSGSPPAAPQQQQQQQPAPPPPAASGPAPASQPSQRPSFRGGVDVVSLNVTVTDQS